jgi:hypothetical protein
VLRNNDESVEDESECKLQRDVAGRQRKRLWTVVGACQSRGDKANDRLSGDAVQVAS